VATEQFPPAGLSPARTATSIAARTFSTLFCESFLRCLSPYHGGPTECICLVLPQCLRPFPCRCRVGFPLLSANAIFRGEGFRGCSYFVMFRPPSWLASRIAPTAAGFPAGQLRRLRPSRTCVVAFARIGYARRPTTGNWRHEDFHLARFTVLSTAPSTAFPPHSPPTVFCLCSNDSSVLYRRVTPRGRTCGPCGYCLRPPSCCLVLQQVSPRSPGSRA
jgi:hypothetical protein